MTQKVVEIVARSKPLMVLWLGTGAARGMAVRDLSPGDTATSSNRACSRRIVPASEMEIVQVVELLSRPIVGRRCYWLQTEPEQLECFVLGRGRPGDHGEWIFRG